MPENHSLKNDPKTIDIRFFYDSKSSYEFFSRPFNCNDRLLATNGYMVLSSPESSKYERIRKEELFYQHPAMSEILEAIEKNYDFRKMPKNFSFSEPEKCPECGKDASCDLCNGTNVFFSSRRPVILLELCVNATLFHPLRNIPDLEIGITENRKAIVFRTKMERGLIMGLRKEKIVFRTKMERV